MLLSKIIKSYYNDFTHLQVYVVRNGKTIYQQNADWIVNFKDYEISDICQVNALKKQLIIIEGDKEDEE